MKQNPFILSGYKGPEYFCDRENEKNRILGSIRNQRNITIASPRRMGKTGLILHTFHELSGDKSIYPVYFDVLGTTNLGEFSEFFGNALLGSVARTDRGFKRIMKQLIHLRPELRFDPLSGEPKISFDIRNQNDALTSLDSIFNLIKGKEGWFVVAIDEFQQILQYPEKNMEAILRSYVQQTTNTVFIFSGSKRHLLADMFSNPARPFFGSTEMLFLETVPAEDYHNFIKFHFTNARKEIEDVAIDRIFSVTALHTYYIQFLCNRLYSSFNRIRPDHVESTLVTILRENEAVYANYLNVLTTTQFRTLRAIAVEGEVESPNSKEFLQKYDLGAASTVSQAILSLIAKEFIMRDQNKLVVQDKFFREWLKLKSHL